MCVFLAISLEGQEILLHNYSESNAKSQSLRLTLLHRFVGHKCIVCIGVISHL